MCDEREDHRDQQTGGGHLLGHGSRGRGCCTIVRRVVWGKERFVDADVGKWEGGCKEEWKAFGEVVVPSIAAVECRERLDDVKVKEPEGWQGEEAIIEAVTDQGENDSERPVVSGQYQARQF